MLSDSHIYTVYIYLSHDNNDLVYTSNHIDINVILFLFTEKRNQVRSRPYIIEGLNMGMDPSKLEVQDVWIDSCLRFVDKCFKRSWGFQYKIVLSCRTVLFEGARQRKQPLHS